MALTEPTSAAGVALGGFMIGLGAQAVQAIGLD
jgi:hypothetical protein